MDSRSVLSVECIFHQIHSIKSITSSNHSSAIGSHVTSSGDNMKRDHFEILAKGRSDTHCKIKETLLIRDLEPSLDEKVSSEKLYLFWFARFFYMQIFQSPG